MLIGCNNYTLQGKMCEKEYEQKMLVLLLLFVRQNLLYGRYSLGASFFVLEMLCPCCATRFRKILLLFHAEKFTVEIKKVASSMRLFLL